MDRQSTDNQRGEIEFRRKLHAQQTGGDQQISHEVSAEDLEPLLRQRMAETREVMEALRDGGTRLTPFVEFGAERGQRSLAMVNELGAPGFAADLSLDMLSGCEVYRERFELAENNRLVCTNG